MATDGIMQRGQRTFQFAASTIENIRNIERVLRLFYWNLIGLFEDSSIRRTFNSSNIQFVEHVLI